MDARLRGLTTNTPPAPVAADPNELREALERVRKSGDSMPSFLKQALNEMVDETLKFFYGEEPK